MLMDFLKKTAAAGALLAAALLASIAVAPPAKGQSNPNQPIVVLSSAARTAATVNSADQTNISFRCVHVVMNVTAYTSGNYTAYLQAPIPATPTVYYNLLVGPAVSSTGTTVLKMCPGSAPLANAVAADILPKTWRVQMIGASTPSMTFSVSGYLGN